MPRVKPGTTVRRRSKKELAAHRQTLKAKQCVCGHFAVSADDYYDTSGARGNVCVDCYREGEKVRQQKYRDGKPGKPITIEDLRNPARKSGFDHVGPCGRGPTSGRSAWKWCAQKRYGPGSADIWKGPARKTSEEAAQDYIDYINAQQSAAIPATLKSAGHAYDIDKTDRDPEVEAALGVLRDARAQRQGKQGYVYCIAHMEGGAASGGFNYVKVGYSVNPQKRVAELQTGNPYTLKLLCLKQGTEADEKALHAKYIKDNILQEWFAASKALMLEFDRDENGVLFTEKANNKKGVPIS